MLIAISAPPNHQRGPAYAEQVLAAIHQANPKRLPVTFSFGPDGETIRLYCRFPQALADAVLKPLGAAYPDCSIGRLDDETLRPPKGAVVRSAGLRLSPDLFPIRRYPEFDDAMNRNTADPLAGVLAMLAPEEGLRAKIEITTRPASPRRCRQAGRAIVRLARPFFRDHHWLARLYATAVTSSSRTMRIAGRLLGLLAPRPTVRPAQEGATASARSHDREGHLQAASDKMGRHLFEARMELTVFGPPDVVSRAEAMLDRLAGTFGHFTEPRLATFRRCRARRWNRPRSARGFLLSAEELATLWHPATGTVRAPRMEMTQSRELEPPPVLPVKDKERDLAVLGRVRFRNRREVFGIRLDDRRRHVAILGKTGMGKSTLLQNLIVSDILAGRGVALIDPHGDLADVILESVPARRTNDVVLLDAGDRAYPIAFNPFAHKSPDERPLVASAIVSAFKKLYADSWGPRLEHILRNAVLALLEIPGTSLISVLRLLGDSQYRKTVAGQLSDPVVRGFWQNEFAGWNVRYRSEAIAPIQNKVGQFASQPILRAILGQSRSTLDLRQVMDEGRILIVNLSKGKIGEDASTLLGSLLVSCLQLAAMSRADLAEVDRNDFSLAVDECQNYATESLATILSEGRKFRLTAILACQHLFQMNEETREALFGNVGNLLAFQVGAPDAKVLAEQFDEEIVSPRDLMALPRFTAIARILVEGMPSRSFSMETLPPTTCQKDPRRADIIRRVSRRRYARQVEEIETEIATALAV